MTMQEIIIELENFRVSLPLRHRKKATKIIDKVIEKLTVIPEVVIEVHGGVAELITKSKGVQVTITDYDGLGDNSQEIWDESEKI